MKQYRSEYEREQAEEKKVEYATIAALISVMTVIIGLLAGFWFTAALIALILLLALSGGIAYFICLAILNWWESRDGN